MIRVQRLIYYLLILAFFGFLSFTLLPSLKATQPASLSSTSDDEPKERTKAAKADPNGEKYLSWFPHR